MKIGSSNATTSVWMVAGTAATTTMIVSLWIRHILQNKMYQQSTSKVKEDHDDWEQSSLWLKTELTKSETRQITGTGLTPVSTVTWFTTTATTTTTSTATSTSLPTTEVDKDNVDAIIQVARIVEDRLKAIVQANPWLCGRIMKQKKTGKYFLVYANPKEQGEKASFTLKQDVSGLDLFHHVTTPPTGFGPDTNDPSNTCKPFLLKYGCDLSQQFLKVCIIPSCGTTKTTSKDVPSHSSSSSFALTASMSHLVGDGYTFYTIHNMLVGAIPIRSLNPVRVQNTGDLQSSLVGKAEYSLAQSSGFIASYLRGLLFASISTILRRIFVLGTKKEEEQNPRYILVDKMKMERLKQEAVVNDPNASFVSSNDVITSWFFRNCGNRTNAFMVFDVRNRAPGHTKDLAGNYNGVLYYDATLDAATPVLIRQSLKTWRRVVTTTLPSPLSWGLFGSSAMITNWASHHSAKVDFSCSSDGTSRTQVKPLLHLPLMGDIPVAPTFRFCVIFQARPNQLAVCIYDGTFKPELQKAPFEKTVPDTDMEGTLFGIAIEQ